MIETPNVEARFKARLDLWMHANTLMWSRLQSLNYLQVAYFIVSGYSLQPQCEYSDSDRGGVPCVILPRNAVIARR